MKRLHDAKQLGDHPYTIQIVGDRPTCTCLDFQRHNFPCKHLLKSWLTDDGELIIPDTASDPWWNIDESVSKDIKSKLATHSPQQMEESCANYDSDEVSQSNPIQTPDIPEPQPWIPPPTQPDLKHNIRIKELLKVITGLAHQTELCQTEASSVINQLRDIQNVFKSKVQTINNIPLNIKPQNQRKRQHKNTLKEASCALKRRKYMPAKYRSSFKNLYMVKDLESCTADKPATGDKPIATEPKTTPAKTKLPKVEVPVSITKLDHMLDDNDINMALNLMKTQWAEEGLKTQDCLLIQRKKGFDAALECGFGDFAQIIHMKEQLHWIAVTNVAAKPNEVRLFDSLDMTPTTTVQRAIASEYRTRVHQRLLKIYSHVTL